MAEKQNHKQRKLLTDTGKISGAQGIGYLFNLVGGLIVAGLLGTRLYGIWKAVQLVLDYSAYLNLGANHGVDRLAPALVSKGNQKRYSSIFVSSLSFSLLIHFVVAVCVFTSVFFVQDESWRMALLALSVLIFFQPFFNHGDSGLGAEKKFGRKAQVFLIMTITRVILSVCAAYLFGLAGVLVVFVSVIIWAAWKMVSSLSIKPKFDLSFQKARSLIFAGSSITILVVLERLILSLDRIIVGFTFGTETFGVYQLVVFPMPVLLLLPFALRQTTQTEVYDRMGQSGKLTDCWDIFSRSVTAISLSLPFVMGAVFLGMPFLISRYLVDFQEAIPGVQLFALTSYFLIIVQTTFSIIVVAKKAKQILIDLIIIIFSFSILALIAGIYYQHYIAVLLVQSTGWAVVALWMLRSALTWFKVPTSRQIFQLLMWFLPLFLTAIWLPILHLMMVSYLEWPKFGWLYGFGGGVLHTVFCLGFFALLEKQTGGMRFIISKLTSKL